MLGQPRTEGWFLNMPVKRNEVEPPGTQHQEGPSGESSLSSGANKGLARNTIGERRAEELRAEREGEVARGTARTCVWKDGNGVAVEIQVPPTVYPPREDSSLLDAVLSRLGGSPGRMLEIGCGSGVITVSAAARGWLVDACDVNPLAVAATRGLALESGVADAVRVVEAGPEEDPAIPTVDCDWAPAPPYDLICWNLPYIEPVGNDEERLGPFEEVALTDLDQPGGWSRLLRQRLRVGDLLTDDGLVILIHAIDGRGGVALTEWLADGWSMRPLGRLSFDRQRLVAMALWRGWAELSGHRLGSVDSTMDELADTATAGCHVSASAQLRGRGQRDHEWLTEAGDLIATWRLVAAGDPVDRPMGSMQLDAGMAICDAIAAHLGRTAPMVGWPHASSLRAAGVRLRWPNDIIIEGKGKVAGVLMQGRSIGDTTTIDLGIGINGRSRTRAGEQHSGVESLGLPADATLLLDSLSAALGGRLERHPRLPMVPIAEQHSQWWALAAGQDSEGQWSAGTETRLRVVGIDVSGGLRLLSSEAEEIIQQSGAGPSLSATPFAPGDHDDS